jgi:peptidoglycan hydrolase-like protein with peptidoglycan-binding domain
MRRSAAALAASLALAVLAGGLSPAPPASGQESFSGWRGGPIREGSGFRFPEGSARVREVQRHLRYLGYSLSGEDGKFGAQTERAVRRFERREGLPVDGVVDVPTIRALRAAVVARRAAQERRGATGGGSTAPVTGATRGDGAPAAPVKDAAPASGRPSPAPPAPREDETLAGSAVVSVALVLALLVVGAAVLVRRRLAAGSREEDVPEARSQALSERIAAMRASGLSPQEVAERLRRERSEGDVAGARGAGRGR